MKNITSSKSTCCNCQFFIPDGIYYGRCVQLDVPVAGKCSRCHLGVVAFQSINQYENL